MTAKEKFAPLIGSILDRWDMAMPPLESDEDVRSLLQIYSSLFQLFGNDAVAERSYLREFVPALNGTNLATMMQMGDWNTAGLFVAEISGRTSGTYFS